MKRDSRAKKTRVRALLSRWKPFLLFSVSAFLFLLSIVVIWASFIKLPDFNEFRSRKVVESTKIYDRTGEVLLYDVHQNIKRTVVPLNAISPYLKTATLAVEDSGFYSHSGIEPRAIIRAFFANLLGAGFKQGGSTITQQVVKKTLLTDEKVLARKIKELILSFRLESNFSKDEILTLYLNEIPYGGNIYGIGEASRVFFNKEAAALTLTESAYLAALPNAPTYYSPYGNHRGELELRKNFVLKRMRDLGYITATEYGNAMSSKASFSPKEPTGIKAPHFVEWIKEYLADKYGELAIEENGYKVITTLDYSLQKKAEDIITKYAPEMQSKFGAKNMALVAIDPKTGQVLSMVGSRDYFEKSNDGNFNVALAQRQPGSTFKPFAYATAFKKGYTPETVLFDLPTNFSVACDSHGVPLSPPTKKEDCYMPENFEGGFRGPLSMRSSLAQSRNITSVKTLYLAGINDTIATAKEMGITSLNDRSRLGLSLVLGGGEVSLLDITGAYGVFANDGEKAPVVSILKIEDRNGKTIEDFKLSTKQVLPVEVARQITSILSDNTARTPTFGANSNLYFPNRDVAVKTGTTNDYRDVWTVGYTPQIVVGMWGGNNDNKPIKKGNSASYTVTTVWRAFMLEIMKTNSSERFTPPEPQDLTTFPAPLQGIWLGGEKHIIDISSGKLATPLTPSTMQRVLVVPEVHTILHWINKDDPRGPPPINPQNDPQYKLWEEPIRAWVMTQNISEGDRSAIPSEYDTTRTTESVPAVFISGIDPIIKYKSDESIPVTINVSSKYPVGHVELYINGELIEKKITAPFLFNFTPNTAHSLSTQNTLTAVVYDSILNKGVSQTQLLIQE